MALWKLVFVVLLAAGALAKFQLSEDGKKSISNVVMQQCAAAGALEKFTEVRNSTFRMVYCVNDLIDLNEFMNLFKSNSSESNENSKELFKNYCAKVPQLKTCMHNELTSLKPCFPDYFNEHHSFDELLDYVCYNDGERYSEYIAANGPKCVTDQLRASSRCSINATYKIRELLEAGIRIKDVPLNMMCSVFDTFTSCFTEKLRECDSQIPANMFAEVLQITRKGSRCKNIPVELVKVSDTE